LPLESLDCEVSRFIGIESRDQNVFLVEASDESCYVEVGPEIRKAGRLRLEESNVVDFCLVDDIGVEFVCRKL
jgi:hypothetical protein